MSLSGRSVEGVDHVEAECAIMDGKWKDVSMRTGVFKLNPGSVRKTGVSVYTLPTEHHGFLP
ncbi:MAG: hypothetical protein E3J86_05225 [Candidatus Thorarchaeota archaeon]|nr:MAG: hypothetical protein E3J86_05225 [Candidatus Thorarchaeota archaeon]